MHKYSVVVSLLEFSAKKLTQLPPFNVFPVSALLKRIEKKQAMGLSEVMGSQVCSIPSPKTTVKNDKGTVRILIVYSG